MTMPKTPKAAGPKSKAANKPLGGSQHHADRIAAKKITAVTHYNLQQTILAPGVYFLFEHNHSAAPAVQGVMIWLAQLRSARYQLTSLATPSTRETCGSQSSSLRAFSTFA